MSFPNTGVLDDFTRADEAPLSAAGIWTLYIDGSSSGDVQLSSNKVALSSTGPNNYGSAYTDASYAADQEAFLTVDTMPGNGNFVSVVLRIQSTNIGTINWSGYQFQATDMGNGTMDFAIYRHQSGGFTQVGSTVNHAVSAGDKILASAIGTRLRFYVYNSAAWALTAIGSNSDVTGSGRVGFFLKQFTGRVDNFGGGADASYIKSVRDDTPWVYYPLDEASGSPLDQSGNGRDVTSIDGTIAYRQAGPFFGSYSNKAGDSSQFNRTSPPNTVTSIAVEMWAKLGQTPGSNARKFFSVGNATSGIDLFYNTDGKFYGVVNWISGPTTLSTSTAALSTSAFAHIVVTRESGTWKYYVNGAVDTASAGTQQMGDPSTQTLHVGTDLSSDYSTYVSHFAYYTGALTSTRVAAHYSASQEAHEVTGSATSAFTGGGTADKSVAKSGAGVSAFAASGADAVTTSETGTGIAPFTGSGAQVAGAKFGLAIAPFTGSGARQINKNNRGSGVAVFTGSGTKLGSTLSKAGTGISARTGTASDVVTYVESGRAIISNVAGGGTAVLAQGSAGGTTGDTGNSATDSRGGILGGAYPTTTITGACSNPILVNLTTGETMYWRSIELLDGEVMIVDHLNRSTKIDGVDAPGPSGEYWALIAETNTIQAGAEERGANFTVTMTYAEVLI